MVTPQHQRGRGDGLEPVAVVGPDQPLPGVPVDPPRRLAALGDERVEELRCHRTVHGARSELPREVVGDLVGQVGDRRPHLLDQRVPHAVGRADEHHPVDPVGVLLGHPTDDEAAERVAHQVRPLHAERVAEGDQVVGEPVEGVAGLRVVGVAEPALAVGDGAQPRVQVREDVAPGEPGVRPAVHQDDGWAAGVTLPDGVQPQPAGEGHGVVAERLRRLGHGISLGAVPRARPR